MFWPQMADNYAFLTMHSTVELIRYIAYVVMKESARKPPRRARRKAVPMKLVTILAETDGGKCMNLAKYSTRLLAVAKYAMFSNTSTADIMIAMLHTNLSICNNASYYRVN